MTWLDTSIMRTRGVARGRTPDTHALTEAKQGKYHYTSGPYSDPVLHLRPGDRVVVETRDAFEGAIKTEQDLPAHDAFRQPAERPDPGGGGAKKGDVLAVYIESMAPRGTCAMIPHFGALSGTAFTALMSSTTSSGSTTRLDVTRRSATSARYSSRKLKKLRPVSTKLAAAQTSTAERPKNTTDRLISFER